MTRVCPAFLSTGWLWGPTTRCRSARPTPWHVAVDTWQLTCAHVSAPLSPPQAGGGFQPRAAAHRRRASAGGGAGQLRRARWVDSPGRWPPFQFMPSTPALARLLPSSGQCFANIPLRLSQRPVTYCVLCHNALHALQRIAVGRWRACPRCVLCWWWWGMRIKPRRWGLCISSSMAPHRSGGCRVGCLAYAAGCPGQTSNQPSPVIVPALMSVGVVQVRKPGGLYGTRMWYRQARLYQRCPARHLCSRKRSGLAAALVD